MATFRVVTQDGLNDQDLQSLLMVIEQMRGVERIDSLQWGEGAGPQAPHQPPHSPQQPAYAPPPNYGQQQGYKPPQQDMHGRNHAMDGNQPQPGGGQQGFKGPMSETSQRKFISSSIKWGVKNGKVDLNAVKNMTPEETISLAMKLADMMPDEEKSNLADIVQKH